MKPRMITTPTNFNETQIKVKNLQENIIKQAKDTSKSTCFIKKWYN